MKRLLTILICVFGLTVYAADYAPFASPMPIPAAAIQSVNNADYMISGSAYRSEIYGVGSYSPSAAPVSGPRFSGPDKDPDPDGEGGYNPNNPQFSPLGDALIPLLLLAFVWMAIIYLRRNIARTQ